MQSIENKIFDSLKLQMNWKERKKNAKLVILQTPEIFFLMEASVALSVSNEKQTQLWIKIKFFSIFIQISTFQTPYKFHKSTNDTINYPTRVNRTGKMTIAEKKKE